MRRRWSTRSGRTFHHRSSGKAGRTRRCTGRLTAPVSADVCARHGTARARWKSSCQVIAEPKARRRARASTVRWGAKEAPSTRAGRRPGTGDEVWHTRDERARDRDVLHPQGVCLINPASRRGTCWVLPWESCRSSQKAGLRAEGAVLTDRQKSVAGLGGAPQARLVRHPKADRRGNGEAEP
jgi:hypothetical protein